MGQRRSKLDRHAAELLALRRGRVNDCPACPAGFAASAAPSLRPPRSGAGSRTCLRSVGLIPPCPTTSMPPPALDRQRARDRELRFPRLAVSQIDQYGYHVLRLRAQGASIGECHQALRDEHGLQVDRSTVSRWLKKHANGAA